MSSWTPERREKQSEVAKQLVAEGKFGGKGRGQGRPRKKRASEIVAEKVTDEGQAIFDRLMEITRYGKDANSISAAKTLLDTEEKERKLQLEEEQAYEDMRGNELAELLYTKLMELSDDGEIKLPFIEGELISIDEGGTDSFIEESGPTSEES